jgi:hypothetical protein
MLAIAVCVLWIGWFILKTKFCESYPRQPEIRCALQMARVGQSSAAWRTFLMVVPDANRFRRGACSKPTVSDC